MSGPPEGSASEYADEVHHAYRLCPAMGRHALPGPAPCGCLDTDQHYHVFMDPVHIDEAYVECEGCGAVWYDLDGDEWVFGDRSVR